MTFIEKVKTASLNPNMFYQRIKAEVGIIEAFKYLIILSIGYTIMSFVSSLFLSYFLFSIFYGIGYPSIIPVYGIFGFGSLIRSGFTFVGLMIGPFISAGIMHLFTKMFGGKNDYSATYKVTVYSSTPTLVIGWIPYVGWLVSFYSLYLFIKGLSILHDISMSRAFLVILIPIIIVVIIMGAIAFFWLTSILYTYRTPIDMIPTGQIYSILSKYFDIY
ncbi:MAG: YIP1 family protein [Candidatus Aenigmarchaeota archaeon]|nr:YIP1 family protein [Candidatus Aenigmarchaeota archaeon]